MYHAEGKLNSTARHPYFDPDYLFDLILKAGLLYRSDISSLNAKLSVPEHKGLDIIQWLVGLRLPRRDGKGAIIEEHDLLSLVAKDQGWDFRRLDPIRLDMNVVTKTLPASFAKRRLVLPVGWAGQNILEIACYDPLDKELFEDLKRACKSQTKIVVATKSDIEKIIREFFDFRKSIQAAQNVLSTPDVDVANLEQYVQLASADGHTSDRYVQKAVDHLFQYALSQRASDIHIEPKRNESIVRLRIDGILHTIYRIPRVVHDAMCSRIKGLSRMDIAEKRRPQDGRMKIGWNNEEAEVRVSTVPVAFGEKVVLRLQSADILFSDLNKLGFSVRDLEAYENFLKHTHGIVLVTGPTGSGKSTTLYSTLRHLSSPDVNIVTVEDPIEMVHEEFNQIAVQPHIDVTFSTILRNILRQDPDIVMIGEIRDAETARYAVQAALTGHLVFSTLHTNDSVSAVTRLKDLGLEPYLIASTLRGVVAQRLVRKVCRHCRKSITIPADKIKGLGCAVEADPVRVAVGEGCSSCRNTGHLGRIGIYEVFSVTETSRDLIHQERSEEEVRRQALKDGMRPLRYDACSKLLAGITSVDEVLRLSAV